MFLKPAFMDVGRHLKWPRLSELLYGDDKSRFPLAVDQVGVGAPRKQEIPPLFSYDSEQSSLAMFTLQ